MVLRRLGCLQGAILIALAGCTESSTFSLQHASTSPVPTAQPARSAASTKPGVPAYGGHLDYSDCATIQGWAWDANQPESRVIVDLFEGAAQVGSTVADRFRPDLVKAQIGDGKHGFTFSIPALLKDGKTHEISGLVHGSTAKLSKTRTVLCTAAVQKAGKSAKSQTGAAKSPKKR